jgi:NAD(P)H-flavin reductase
LGFRISVGGPYSDVTYQKSILCVPGFDESLRIKTLSLIAGGTGITPCYQIIKAAIKDNVRINLIYANSSIEDILLKEELEKI